MNSLASERGSLTLSTDQGGENPGSASKILFVAHAANWSGSTISLHLLVKHLKRRYDVTVLVPRTGVFVDVLQREGVDVIEFRPLTRVAIPELFRLIRREGVSLVYGNNGSERACRNALIAAKLARVPFVAHYRTMPDGHSPLRDLYLNLADAVVTVSHACADILRGRVRATKLTVVWNGIEASAFSPLAEAEREHLRQDLGVPGGATLAVSVGSIKPIKGQHWAVRALAQARREDADLCVLLVGPTRSRRYLDRLRELARNAGVEERVRFVGFRKDIPKILSASDVLLHTATSEAFGRVLIEGMAARLPVVAFSCDGIAEVVEDGVTGYLLPPGDLDGLGERLTTLTSNSTLRARMGEAGRQRVVKRFSASRTARQVNHVIDDVLAPKLVG